MRLIDLQAGDNIIIHVNMNGQFADFPSVVIKQQGDGILAEAVRIGGKVVGFSSESIHLDLYYIRHDKPPVIWKNVKCTTVLFDNKTLYNIAAFAEGYESNRRNAFRMFIGLSGVAQLGINRKALSVIVKDVSESGFSFVSSEDIENVINMPVRLVFEDIDRNYSLMGLVVRRVVIDEKKILYGCKLSVENLELVKYINYKQRKQMAINKNDSVYKMRERLQQSLREESGANKILIEKGSAGGGNRGSAHEKNRVIDDVEKQERRGVFKEKHIGKNF